VRSVNTRFAKCVADSEKTARLEPGWEMSGWYYRLAEDRASQFPPMRRRPMFRERREVEEV